MNGRVHDFGESLRLGQARERRLDAYFGQRYGVGEPGRQREGIDRMFRVRETGRRFAVEYKADDRARATGNAFIETISVDTVGKAGWSTTSRADLLVYWDTGNDRLYIVRLDRLRAALPAWLARYPVRVAQNRDYRTHGVCVPLAELGRVAGYILTGRTAPPPALEALL